MNQNEPAYPSVCVSQNMGTGQIVNYQTYGGLTKREHFAAMAMQAAISNAKITPSTNYSFYAELARQSTLAADVLLAALEATPAQQGKSA